MQAAIRTGMRVERDDLIGLLGLVLIVAVPLLLGSGFISSSVDHFMEDFTVDLFPHIWVVGFALLGWGLYKRFLE